jgi:class 3 adenylate cyclase
MPSAVTINLALNGVVTVGLLVCICIGIAALDNGYRTSLLLSDTKDLAQELRQSSDDLTRFIRTYTVTGNTSYWTYFNQVIDIRNGVAPLVEEPARNYWDLFITDGRPPRPLGPAAALLDRMEAAGFTPVEMEYLEEAKRQSDALIDLEVVASNAMVGLYRPTTAAADAAGLNATERLQFTVSAPPNQTLAADLVHSVPYHQWKGRIMRPIDDFAAAGARRVLDGINRNFQLNLIVVVLLFIFLLCLIALLGLFFFKISKDSQAEQLLATVLPERVVEHVSINDFQELRKVAAAHAKCLRKGMEDPDFAFASGFPVLFSEFVPTAWVAFTDVVGFTSMCRSLPALSVISMLNELFAMLDVEASLYNVMKIKTIGDCFMCCRLPSEADVTEQEKTYGANTPAKRLGVNGYELLCFLYRAHQVASGVLRPTVNDVEAAASDDEYLCLRTGIHCGPVASGIVGFERPLFDIFGDTVNTAARLESSGAPNKIQMLAKDIPFLDEHSSHLNFDSVTNTVNLKGLGEVETRFVLEVRDYSRSSVGSRMSGRRKSTALSRSQRSGGSRRGSRRGNGSVQGGAGAHKLTSAEPSEDAKSAGSEHVDGGDASTKEHVHTPAESP